MNTDNRINNIRIGASLKNKMLKLRQERITRIYDLMLAFYAKQNYASVVLENKINKLNVAYDKAMKLTVNKKGV